MNEKNIKHETIKLINGVSYLSTHQIDAIELMVCENLGIEPSDEVSEYVREACKAYFDMQNNFTFN